MKILKNVKHLHLINVFIWLLWPMGLSMLLILMFFTCSNKPAKAGGEASDNHPVISRDSIVEKKTFPMVEVPAMLSSPEARAAYLASHYWDRFDFSDTSYLHLPEVTEQAFVNFLSILPHTDNETATRSIKSMLQKSIDQDASGLFYAYLLDKYKNYLADPNSPLRNEAYYITVAQHILSDSISDEVTKSRAGFDLKMMLKNRVGSVAADFSYLTANNKQGRLHKLKSAYLLLYFNNPDCQACAETTAYLKESPLIHHLLKKGMLTILAVYPDEDVSAWQAHQGEIPRSWINSRDAKQLLNKKQLYDLKAIPSLYLLDKEKKVLLKDAPVQAVEQYLNQLTDIK